MLDSKLVESIVVCTRGDEGLYRNLSIVLCCQRCECACRISIGNTSCHAMRDQFERFFVQGDPAAGSSDWLCGAECDLCDLRENPTDTYNFYCNRAGKYPL